MTLDTNIYKNMDQICRLIDVAGFYGYCSAHYNNHISAYIDENGIRRKSFHNEFYDDHYNTCYDAATKFINTSEVFSDFTPEEIIKVFTNIEFKDNNILIDDSISSKFNYGILMNYYTEHMKFFEYLLQTNKEMFVALIRALNDRAIHYDNSHSLAIFMNKSYYYLYYSDNWQIKNFSILLRYGSFNFDHLKLSEEAKNCIKPTHTKKAIS